MNVILSSLSLMVASLLALVRGIAIAIIIMQAVSSCSVFFQKTIAKGVSTRRRRGEGMQLPYSQYRGRNAGGY